MPMLRPRWLQSRERGLPLRAPRLQVEASAKPAAAAGAVCTAFLNSRGSTAGIVPEGEGAFPFDAPDGEFAFTDDLVGPFPVAKAC